MILKDSIQVGADPEAVFRFFDDMDRNYRTWHPAHVLFRWEQGHGVSEGNVFYFEEHLVGHLQKKRVVFTKVERGRTMEFAPTSRFLRLFLPRLSFTTHPAPDGCVFEAQIHIRMGPLAAWLNRKDIAAVRQHMREEGENLKRLLEGGASGTTESVLSA